MRCQNAVIIINFSANVLKMAKSNTISCQGMEWMERRAKLEKRKMKNVGEILLNALES